MISLVPHSNILNISYICWMWFCNKLVKWASAFLRHEASYSLCWQKSDLLSVAMHLRECFTGRWVWCDICVLDEDWCSRIHHMTHLSLSRCLSLSTFTHFKLLSVPFAFRLIFLVRQHWVKLSGNILFSIQVFMFNNSLLCNNMADYSSIFILCYWRL